MTKIKYYKLTASIFAALLLVSFILIIIKSSFVYLITCQVLLLGVYGIKLLLKSSLDDIENRFTVINELDSCCAVFNNAFKPILINNDLEKLFHKQPECKLSDFLRIVGHQLKSDAFVENNKIIDLDYKDLIILTNIKKIFNKDKVHEGFFIEFENVTEKRKQEKLNNYIVKATKLIGRNVMIANDKNDIIYMNEAMKNTFRKVEKHMQQQFSYFSVDKLIGMNIDVFHKNPEKQHRILSALVHEHKAEFPVSNQWFAFTAHPIRDESNNKVGVVVEWENVTDKKNIQNEFENIIKLASQGNLETQISLEGKQGFYLQYSTLVNEFIKIMKEFTDDIISCMQPMSDGDFTHKMQKDYHGRFHECKSYINNTVSNLAKLISVIRILATELEDGVAKISEGNVNLQQRTESQASALEETSASVEEMSRSIKQNSENSQKAYQLVLDSVTKAETGGAIVQHVVEEIDKMDQSSKKIAEIIAVIDELAFQTNLLALNAAVEAARAGEHGRGFSVVAYEVRNLAQRSAQHAKDIRDLINNSIEQVSSGVKFAKQSGDALTDIVNSVVKVNEVMKSISIASDEQSNAAEQISMVVVDMNKITNQNNVLVESVTGISQKISQSSKKLMKQLQLFKVNISDKDLANTVERKIENAPVFTENTVSSKEKLKELEQDDTQWESF